jgi:hypothetical protein
MNELEQLKKLVFENGWDDESKEYVKKLEANLHELAIREKLADSPAIKPFIDYLAAEIDRAEKLLKNDESLTEKQRTELFAIMKHAKRFTFVFNGKEREATEAEINRLLDVVKTNQAALNS